ADGRDLGGRAEGVLGGVLGHPHRLRRRSRTLRPDELGRARPRAGRVSHRRGILAARAAVLPPMCVLFFALDRHPRHRLVFAGNRDEFYRRPTAPAAPWSECPGVIAGRDLEAGGTWLGVRGAGRWAVVTNVRDLPAHRPGARSRGALVSDFLCGAASAADFAAEVFAARAEYNPFNLLVDDGEALWYVSTHTDAAAPLGPGVYGLSNATLGVRWPKVQRGLETF